MPVSEQSLLRSFEVRELLRKLEAHLLVVQTVVPGLWDARRKPGSQRSPKGASARLLMPLLLCCPFQPEELRVVSGSLTSAWVSTLLGGLARPHSLFSSCS